MKKSIWSLSLLFLLITSILSQSCGKKYERENILLDSLDLSLDQSEQQLDLDMTVITERIAELEKQRDEIHRLHTDTFSYELAQKMGKQRSVLKIYGRSVKDHEKFSKELEVLRKQVDDLRSDLNQAVMDKENFKLNYRNEKTDVDQLAWNTQALRRDLYSIEPVYQRLAPELDGLIEELHKRDRP